MLTFAPTAMQRETRSPLLAVRVVIIANLHLSTKAESSSTFSLVGAEPFDFPTMGLASLEPVSALLNPEDMLRFCGFSGLKVFTARAK